MPFLISNFSIKYLFVNDLQPLCFVDLTYKGKGISANHNKKEAALTLWRPNELFEERYGWDTALRVCDYQGYMIRVETSNMTYVSIDEFARVFPALRGIHGLGEDGGIDGDQVNVIDCSGERHRFSEYRKGVFKVGAHRVPYSEIEGIAKKLGWIDVD